MTHKVICNVTFILPPGQEDKFVEWIASQKGVLTSAAPDGALPSDQRLSAMRMAGGVDYRESDAHSVALQQEFNSAKEARLWSDTILPKVTTELEKDFGPEAMAFTSIFEILPF